MEQMGYNCDIQQEYDKITKKEEVTRVAQIKLITYVITLEGQYPIT